MDEFVNYLHNQGYHQVRRLATGDYVALQRLFYTTGLFVVKAGDMYSWDRRYCYQSGLEAKIAAEYWEGQGDPPGNWIKEKPSNRPNPNYQPRAA